MPSEGPSLAPASRKNESSTSPAILRRSVKPAVCTLKLFSEVQATPYTRRFGSYIYCLGDWLPQWQLSSRDSSVTKATEVQTKRLRNRGSIHGRGKGIFSSHTRQRLLPCAALIG